MLNIILKKNVIATVIGICILSQTVIAQSSTNDVLYRGINLNQQDEANVQSILNKMDNDGDGIVRLDDFMNRSSDRADLIFERLDSNGDDLILKAEFTTTKALKQATYITVTTKQCVKKSTGLSLNNRPSPEGIFASADRDNNGHLSSTEFVTHSIINAFERFNELESNGNGIIDKEEIAAEITTRQLLTSAYKNCVNEQFALNK